MADAHALHERDLPSAAIRLRGAERIYREDGAEFHALKRVDFSVGRGDFVAITGKSGSGKSTLLNVIGCLDRLDGGTLHIDDTDVTSLRDDELSYLRGEKIGFVFQSFHLVPSLSVLENVLFPRRFARDRKVDRTAYAKELLHAVGIAGLASRRPNQLSGGQRQRVALARALINRPSILLADEPTGNLDSATSDSVLELLGGLSAAGQTIVLVTHDDEVAERAARTICMRDGCIV